MQKESLLAEYNLMLIFTTDLLYNEIKTLILLLNRLNVLFRGSFTEISIKNIGLAVGYSKVKGKKRSIVEHIFAWINFFHNLKTIAIKKNEAICNFQKYYSLIGKFSSKLKNNFIKWNYLTVCDSINVIIGRS